MFQLTVKMASLPSDKMTITVSFGGSRFTLTIPKGIKVYEVVQKAAEAFKVKPEGLGFLYQGLQVPEQLTVEVCGCDFTFRLRFQRLTYEVIILGVGTISSYLQCSTSAPPPPPPPPPPLFHMDPVNLSFLRRRGSLMLEG